MKITDQHFETLLRCQIDGTASAEQLDELGRALQESPDRIEQYVTMRDTETLLEWELGFSEVRLSLPDLKRREVLKFRFLKPLAAAAGIALAFFAGTQSPSQKEKPQAAAVLFDSEDAVWKGKESSRNFGAPFQKGESYELERKRKRFGKHSFRYA